MTCLEKTEYAALERIGILVHQFVMPVAVFHGEDSEEVYMWKAELTETP